MDVSDILAAHEGKQSVRLIFHQYHSLKSCRPFRKAVLVEKDIPLEVDAGFLTATDLNPIDAESYEYVNPQRMHAIALGLHLNCSQGRPRGAPQVYCSRWRTNPHRIPVLPPHNIFLGRTPRPTAPTDHTASPREASTQTQTPDQMGAVRQGKGHPEEAEGQEGMERGETGVGRPLGLEGREQG